MNTEFFDLGNTVGSGDDPYTKLIKSKCRKGICKKNIISSHSISKRYLGRYSETFIELRLEYLDLNGQHSPAII